MSTKDAELGYTDTIAYSYDCEICGEHWDTEIFIADYEDEPYYNDNLCPHCHSTVKEAWENLRGYEKAGIAEIVKYFLKRFYNSFITKLKIK